MVARTWPDGSGLEISNATYLLSGSGSEWECHVEIEGIAAQLPHPPPMGGVDRGGGRGVRRSTKTAEAE